MIRIEEMEKSIATMQRELLQEKELAEKELAEKELAEKHVQKGTRSQKQSGFKANKS